MGVSLRCRTRSPAVRRAGWWPWLVTAGLLLAAAPLLAAGPARLLEQDGLPAAEVTSTALDGYGFLWAGTPEGLVRWDGHRVLVLRHGPSEGSLPSQQVNVVLVDRSGHLWVGTGAGLARFDRDSMTFRVFTAGGELPPHAANYVTALAESEGDGLWVGSLGGLHLFDPAARSFRLVPSLSGVPIHALQIGGGGRLWVASERGLVRVDHDLRSGSIEVEKIPLATGGPTRVAPIRALVGDGDGLWLGMGHGLARYDTASGVVRLVEIRGPVLSLMVDGVGSDETLWVGTSQGLLALPSAHLEAERSPWPRRLDGREVRHLERGDSGLVWAATDRGLYSLPTLPPPGRGVSPPRVTFTSLSVDGEMMVPRPGDEEAPLTKEMAATRQLELPSSSRMMAVDFAAFDYARLENLLYSYRLGGFHDYWQETGGDRPQAIYSSLPAGSYVLEARARVLDGPWSEPSRLALEVKPPRWQGIGWLALVLLVLVAVALLVNRVRLARLQRDRQMDLRLREMQEQKLESLATLAGGVAHDFNNLLVGIFGHAELAKLAAGADSPAARHLERILASARRAADLSKQMLFYSGRGNFVVEPLDVSELVREVADSLRPSLDANVRLLVEPDLRLPRIEGDSGQLRHVLSNLIANAVEALDDKEGFIVLRTSVMPCDEAFFRTHRLDDSLPSGDYVVITVDDTGSGIEERALSKIFDPFFSTKSPGRGLGLAAAQGIARSHGGTLRVTSMPGRGSTFQILLPARSRGGSLSSVASRRDEGGRGKVLVVDAEKPVREVARSYFEKLGLDVLEATDTDSALAIFARERHSVALALLDLAPTSGGFETFRELRRLEPALPLVVTGVLSPEEAHRRFDGDEPTAYLEKPLRLVRLQKVVRENVPEASVH